MCQALVFTSLVQRAQAPLLPSQPAASCSDGGGGGGGGDGGMQHCMFTRQPPSACRWYIDAHLASIAP